MRRLIVHIKTAKQRIVIFYRPRGSIFGGQQSAKQRVYAERSAVVVLRVAALSKLRISRNDILGSFSIQIHEL